MRPSLSGPPAPSQPSNCSVSPVAGPEGGVVSAGWARLAKAGLVSAWVLVALVHLFVQPDARLLTWPLGYLFLEVLACASLASRAWRTPGEERLAWGLLAASAFLEVPNLLLTLLQAQGHLSARMAGLSSLFSLATGLLVLAGVLSFPKGLERGRMFRRRVMDSLLFAASLLFLLWVMGVQGSLRSAAQGVGLRVFAGYLNVALLGGGLVFMTSYQPDRVRGPLGWLGASAGAWFVALSCWTLAGLPAVVATRDWIILAGGIPLFQGLAAWSPRSVDGDKVGADPQGKVAGLFPYLPVAMAIVVLAVLLAWAPGKLTREAFALFLALVVILLLRQFQAIQDLLAARRTLELRVLQRTQALQQAQDTLLRTERMNTLALMGAGLAHDLNNLLCAVKSSADLVVMNLEDGVVPGAKDLIRIATAADRAALLTRRLMGFARREAEELQPMDLGKEVSGMEGMLRLLLPRSVVLRIEVPAGDLLIVQSSRLRLEQMMVNLVANARDAMPAGGNLTIRVERGEAGTDLAMLEVADSGTGMTPDILARIFDPFFTTKAPGKGTGLGLSSLKPMVEEGGGRMEVESEPGRGSRFRILIPILTGVPLNPR